MRRAPSADSTLPHEPTFVVPPSSNPSSTPARRRTTECRSKPRWIARPFPTLETRHRPTVFRGKIESALTLGVPFFDRLTTAVVLLSGTTGKMRQKPSDRQTRRIVFTDFSYLIEDSFFFSSIKERVSSSTVEIIYRDFDSKLDSENEMTDEGTLFSKAPPCQSGFRFPRNK